MEYDCLLFEDIFWKCPKKTKFPFILTELALSIRAPQLENDFLGNQDGGKTSQNDPQRLGPRSFGSKLMDLNGLKVSHFQLKI